MITYMLHIHIIYTYCFYQITYANETKTRTWTGNLLQSLLMLFPINWKVNVESSSEPWTFWICSCFVDEIQVSTLNAVFFWVGCGCISVGLVVYNIPLLPVTNHFFPVRLLPCKGWNFHPLHGHLRNQKICNCKVYIIVASNNLVFLPSSENVNVCWAYLTQKDR